MKRILLVMIFGVILLNTGEMLGQVVLRDSVKITETAQPGIQVNQLNKSAFTAQTVVQSGFVMPRDGKLIVSYSSLLNSSRLMRFDTFLPSFASLIVNFVSGDSVVIDSLMPRFPNIISFPIIAGNICEFDPFEQHTQIDYRNFSNQQEVYQLDLGKVSKGDTVQFSYDTQFLARASFTVLAANVRDTLNIKTSSEVRLPDSTLVGWSVQLSKRYNICVSGVIEDLRIFVGLANDSLVIDIAGPEEVWPTLRDLDGGNPGGGNIKDTTTVVVTENNLPIANQDVTITARMILPSGGHDHTNQPRQDSLGVFTTLSPDSVTGRGMIIAQTDSNGVIQFKYRAPIYGGQVEFTATTIIDSDTLVARDTLVVKVLDLVDFADIQTNFWRLTGNQPTTGYRGCPGAAIQHAENHYATQSLVNNLQLSILDFFEWSLDTFATGVQGQGFVLGINDMSLVNGGLFDICSTWIPGHFSHRKGTSVDMDRRVVLFDLGTVFQMTEAHIDRLTDFVETRGGFRVLEEEIHYEFQGGGQ